ncbi:MAG: S41 family peptidase [Planctomycetota bacterium]
MTPAVVFLTALIFPTIYLSATETQIRLPRNPAISPDGSQIAFAWQNDIWTADIDGGVSKRASIHAAREDSPYFSPDGKHLYFLSDRSGRSQIYRMSVEGGNAEQITFDSNRKGLHGITTDGRYLLISQSTDRGWHYSESGRVYLFDIQGEKPKKMLFDVGIRDAAISPDGTKVLFVRGRSNWNRKGYQGPQAAQLWLADLTTEPATLTRLSKDRERFQNVAHMDPMWAPDSQTYYYMSDPDGVFDIYQRKLGSEDARQITNVAADGIDDGVAFPCLSRNGNTLLLRRGFDLIKSDPSNGKLTTIELTTSGDSVTSPVERRRLSRATTVAFSPDGKQMAFAAGEDIYVMDRILKEPVQVTNTAHPESSLLFSSNGSRLFYVSDSGGEMDIWEATHQQEDGIWWMAEEFKLRQVTDDRDVEGGLQLSPNGSHVAYVKGSNLFVMDDDGTDHRVIAKMWSPPNFDWSPDGKWITYATQDDNYNGDVYLVPLDGTREPFNLSRHPDYDGSPKWSGDGKRIAWIGRRDGEEIDIYVVELSKATEEETERDEKLKKALEAMKKKGKKPGSTTQAKKPGDPKEKSADPKPDEKKEANKKEDSDKKSDKSKDVKTADKSKDVKIDFDGIFDRVDRLRYSDSSESSLIWIEDGSTLAFSGTISGKRGFYSVKFPRPKTPKRIADSPLSQNRWIKASKEFVGHRSGVPANMTTSGKTETFGFEIRSSRDWREVRKIVFDQGWRAMRDRFYDEAYNNKDWYAMRAKYRPMAAECLGASEFSELMNMMLGELNASHMGHRGGSDPLPNFSAQNDWSPTTYHLGLRYEIGGNGPGLVIESVIPGSPCDRSRSQVKPGETLLKIDGTDVGPDVDLDKILTMEKVRDLTLKVKSKSGEERDVKVRPTSSVGGLLYEEWVEKTRAKVDELSEGKLGYLHIQGMNFRSFRQMEEDLYHAGAGKEGLIIDVRFNGGGSTADHVMTALTQPQHAITRSRGSGEGYPQDRRVYASWTKPIVMMCNEHSFSNAEIVSHAVKQTGRGRLVGMRTAGGVISTGSVGLLDGGSVRMPMRGWYLSTTGEDMELNGCEPHIALWNEPNWDSPGGVDTQLVKAVEALTEDVAAEKAKGKVKVTPASQLRK